MREIELKQAPNLHFTSELHISDSEGSSLILQNIEPIPSPLRSWTLRQLRESLEQERFLSDSLPTMDKFIAQSIRFGLLLEEIEQLKLDLRLLHNKNGSEFPGAGFFHRSTTDDFGISLYLFALEQMTLGNPLCIKDETGLYLVSTDFQPVEGRWNGSEGVWAKASQLTERTLGFLRSQELPFLGGIYRPAQRPDIKEDHKTKPYHLTWEVPELRLKDHSTSNTITLNSRLYPYPKMSFHNQERAFKILFPQVKTLDQLVLVAAEVCSELHSLLKSPDNLLGLSKRTDQLWRDSHKCIHSLPKPPLIEAFQTESTFEQASVRYLWNLVDLSIRGFLYFCQSDSDMFEWGEDEWELVDSPRTINLERLKDLIPDSTLL